MEQKYGKLVWTDDENDWQGDYVKEGTETFLRDMGVDRAKEVIEEITNVFMDNGDMRGRIFYNRKYQSFRETDGPLRLPVCGVKGKHGGEKSRANYTHWYVEREKNLLGESFFREIFGNYFGTEEEYRLLKKPEEMFEKQVRYTTKEDSIQDIPIVYIMERLWEALKQDPSDRIVIVLSKHIASEDAEKSAEEESMDILRQIYRMMPQRLRLTMGFATCVTPIEIVSLVEKEKLPIHIFTTEVDSDLTKLNDSYHVIRMDEEDLHAHNETRQKWLEKLLEFKAKDQLEELLNSSEAEYLKREKEEVNFRAYEAILNPIIIPWYEKEKNGDLLALLKYRKEQEAVLTCGSLEKERRIFFLGQVLPDKEYWRDLVQVIYSYNNMPQNKEYGIDEIREKLGLGYLIDAMQEAWKYAKEYNADALKMIESLQNEKGDQEKIIADLKAEIDALRAGNSEKVEKPRELPEDSDDKKLEIDRLKQEIDELKKEVSEKDKIKKNLIYARKKLARMMEEELGLKVSLLEKDNKEIYESLNELYNEVNKLKEKKGIIHYLKKLFGISKRG